MNQSTETHPQAVLRGSILAISLLAATLPLRAAIPLPEILYYGFNEGSGILTANGADPGGGSDPATVTGHTLDAPGVFGSSALNGAGTGALDTAWSNTLGTGSWSIAFWLSPINTANSTFNYAMGISGDFRAFNGGIAGANGLMLRGTGITDVLISGLSETVPNHIAFVYDSSLSVLRGYLNGGEVTVVGQIPLNINAGNFIVGGAEAGDGSGLRADLWMDEFQLYSRVLSEGGVTDAMNANFIPETSSALMLIGSGMVLLGRRRR